MRKYIYNTNEKHNTHTHTYILRKFVLISSCFFFFNDSSCSSCVYTYHDHIPPPNKQTKSVLQMTTELQFKGRIT